MLLGNRALLNNLLTFLRKPHYPKLPLPYISDYYYWLLIPVLCESALSLLYLALVVIFEKYYEFSTFLVVQAYNLACLLDEVLKVVQRTWLLVFVCVLS